MELTFKLNNMEQTAVEWYNSKVIELMTQREQGNIDVLEFRNQLDLLLTEAKEMEKEKHLNWNKFLESEKTLGISDVKTIERVQWYYNEYYNETFKSE
jgi:hypothetical protein